MWPLALMTKPVPVWVPVLPDLGDFEPSDLAPSDLELSDALGASAFAAAASFEAVLGALKSPALLIPPALIVLTQLAIAPSSGAVEVRLKFSAVLPETATFRLAF